MSRHKRKVACAVAAVACVATLATTATGAVNSKHDSNVIRIGMPTALTGPVTVPGASMQAAANIAISEINRAGGVRVAGKKYTLQLSVSDDKCSPSEAVSAVQQLINLNHVQFMVGGLCSSAVAASMQVVQLSKIPYLITCASTGLIYTSIAQNKWKYLFQFSPNDSIVATNAAKAAWQLMHPRSIAVISEDTAAGHYQTTYFTRYFKAAAPKVKILSVDFVPQTAGTLLPILTKIKAEHPDLINLFFTGVNNFSYAKEAPSIGLQAMLDTAGTEFAQPAFISQFSDVTNYALVNVRWAPQMATKSTNAFRKAFQSAAGRDVDFFALQEYDGIYMLVNALRNSKSLKADDVVKALEHTKSPGVWGTHRFTSLAFGHQSFWPMVVSQVQNGQLTVVWPSAPAHGAKAQIPPWYKK